MNWTQFAMALATTYGIYYGLNILWDFIRSGKEASDSTNTEILVFDETPVPEVVRVQLDEPKISKRVAVEETTDIENTVQPAIGVTPESSGAVRIKQLFELARNEMIEYTHAIPY